MIRCVRILHNRGFTLLELLLALSIFSVVMVSVYGAYRATFTNVGGLELEAEHALMAKVIFERMTKDLESIYTGEEAIFRGESGEETGNRADSLIFSSIAHLNLTSEINKGGVTTIAYTTKQGEEGTLVLSRSDNLLIYGEPDSEDGGVQIPIGEELREVKISYVALDGSETDDWYNEGDEAIDDGTTDLELPVVVRIEIRFAGREDSGQDDSVFRTAIALPQLEVSD